MLHSLPESHLTSLGSDDWYLVRLGPVGQIGRCRKEFAAELKRGVRTICRTARGLEVGVVLASTSPPANGDQAGDGKLLRRMSPEDELLWCHLQQLGEAALETCAAWLKNQNLPAVLLEVEPLLDGRTLYFHFLSEVDEQIQFYLDGLVALYEEQVRQSPFVQLLQNGCGPGCGTSSAQNGCGSRGGCAVCKVAGACGVGSKG